MSALANTFCTAIIGKNATKVTMQNGRKRRDITETARLSTRPTRKSPSAKWVAAVSTEACVMQSHPCAGADRVKHEHGQRHHGSLDGRYGTGSDIRRAGRPIPIRGARCDRAMRDTFREGLLLARQPARHAWIALSGERRQPKSRPVSCCNQ